MSNRRARPLPRVSLERPGRRQEKEFLALVGRSGAFHRPWVKPPRTKAGYAALLRQSRRRSCEAFFVRAAETGELAGAVWITEIVRGV
ncbi:MAG TPA: hypothetical protein VFT32_00175, partial [Candidatus Eisenbacteria bacterium]|nr:hypothetical protein [Candidatus Eisenbacteria bacterium]